MIDLVNVGSVLKEKLSALGVIVIETATESGVPVSHTMGRHKYGKPDLVVMGVKGRGAEKILNRVMELEADGLGLLKEASGNLFDDKTFVLLNVAKEKRERYFGIYEFIFKDEWVKVDLLQVVWSDKSGEYPWSADCDNRVKRMQPILGK